MPKTNMGEARQVAVGVELELVLHADEARGLEVLIGHDDGPRRKRGQRRRRNAVSMHYSCSAPAESLQRRAWREQQRAGRVVELSKSTSKRDRAIASLYFDGLPINRAMIEAALIVGPDRLGMIAAGVLPWVALEVDIEKLEPAAVAEIARARRRGALATGRRRRRFRGRAASE
ncbi:MAG: hypothetical protein ACTHK7_00715 [Aureliella sp.]